jgi:intergrase/recombinase
VQSFIPKEIDYDEFKQWLINKEFSKSYIKNIMPCARKYGYLVNSNSLRELELLGNWSRTHAIKALIMLSKYLGQYTEFKARLQQHGIKMYRTNGLTAFLRILNANNKDTLQWLNQTMPYLRDNEQVFAKFLKLSGLRVSEAITSFNLCIELFKENKLNGYYDASLNVLCHFKYPKLFIRRSKACYITFIKPKLLSEICNSQPVTYASIRKKLERSKIPMRFNELRDIFGTHLVNNGILEIEQNLCCGRIPVSIFIRHYWSPKLKELGKRVFRALESLDNNKTERERELTFPSIGGRVS